MRGVGEFIRAQRESARMSLRRLSEVAGISNPYLSQIERGLRKPSAEILQAIARVNRTYARDGVAKSCGMVVDYYGVAHHLKAALQAYSDEDV